jgi:hypothetical protein
MREKPKREPAGVEILQEGKSGQQLRATIRTKIKAMNTKKSQIWYQHKQDAN